MHIKNNMHLAGGNSDSDTKSMQSSMQRFANGGNSYRQDSNLHFDQSKFNRRSSLRGDA